MECFAKTPGALPPPSTAVHSVWNLMPNNMVGTMPMSQEADVVFTRAPPTTTVTDVKDSVAYETRTPTSHIRRADNIPSNNIAKGYLPKANKKFSLKKTKRRKQRALPPRSQHHSRPSDAEKTFVTQPNKPPIVAGWFKTIVDAKMEELRAYGLAFVVKSLLTAGAQGVQSAPFVSLVADTMLDRLAKKSPKKMKRLERTLRVGAMEAFRLYWKSDGDWSRHSVFSLTGVNKASLLGSLFTVDIVTAGDIGLCLTMLLAHIHFDRLRAIHALLLHADDRLCNQQHLPALIQLQNKLRIVDPRTGLYLWGPVPLSQALIQDILVTIDGWMTVQAYKREHCRMFVESYSTRQPPSWAVGPRLRAGRM